MQRKLGVLNFVSEIKRVENYPDFEKSANVIQHGLQVFIFQKRSKVSQWRQTILVIFCRRKIGVTECPSSLNPGKAIVMAICPIIVHFIP